MDRKHVYGVLINSADDYGLPNEEFAAAFAQTMRTLAGYYPGNNTLFSELAMTAENEGEQSRGDEDVSARAKEMGGTGTPTESTLDDRPKPGDTEVTTPSVQSPQPDTGAEAPEGETKPEDSKDDGAS